MADRHTRHRSVVNGERANHGRRWMGRLPVEGVATMSDAEFRARCDMTRPTVGSLTSRSGLLQGHLVVPADRSMGERI